MTAVVKDFVPNVKNQMIGNCNVNLKTIVNGTSILDFYINVDYVLKPNYDMSVSLNVIFDSISLNDLTVTNFAYGYIDIPSLLDSVEEALDGYIEKNNWTLFKKNVDVSNVIKEINFFNYNENGVIFGGVPLSYPQINKLTRDLKYLI